MLSEKIHYYCMVAIFSLRLKKIINKKKPGWLSIYLYSSKEELLGDDAFCCGPVGVGDSTNVSLYFIFPG